MWSGAGNPEISAGGADGGCARGKFDATDFGRLGRAECFEAPEWTRDGLCIGDCARCWDGYVEIYNEGSRWSHKL